MSRGTGVEGTLGPVTTPARTRTVAVLLYDDVEVLDALGPFEVLTTAARVAARRGEEPPFRVVLVSTTGRLQVTARAGLRVLADVLLDDAGEPDVVLVPGGVHDAVQHDPAVRAWLRATPAEVVASVCTGAFVLAGAGLLDGVEATTHWEDVEDLRTAFPRVRVVEDVRWTDAGRGLTSAGISAGLDLALHLVRRLAGEELAVATARQMDYRWLTRP